MFVLVRSEYLQHSQPHVKSKASYEGYRRASPRNSHTFRGLLQMNIDLWQIAG